MKNKSTEITPPSEPQYAEFVLIAAFRYALGRQSYGVLIVTDWINSQISALSEDAKALMVREIDEADVRGNLGHHCDQVVWKKLRCRLVHRGFVDDASGCAGSGGKNVRI